MCFFFLNLEVDFFDATCRAVAVAQIAGLVAGAERAERSRVHGERLHRLLAVNRVRIVLLLAPHGAGAVSVAAAEATVWISGERIIAVVAVRSVEAVGRAGRRAGLEQGADVVSRRVAVVIDHFAKGSLGRRGAVPASASSAIDSVRLLLLLLLLDNVARSQRHRLVHCRHQNGLGVSSLFLRKQLGILL